MRQNLLLGPYSLSRIETMDSNMDGNGRTPSSTKPPLAIAHPNINTYNTRNGYWPDQLGIGKG